MFLICVKLKIWAWEEIYVSTYVDTHTYTFKIRKFIR